MLVLAWEIVIGLHDVLDLLHELFVSLILVVLIDLLQLSILFLLLFQLLVLSLQHLCILGPLPLKLVDLLPGANKLPYAVHMCLHDITPHLLLFLVLNLYLFVCLMPNKLCFAIFLLHCIILTFRSIPWSFFVLNCFCISFKDLRSLIIAEIT